jgi:hypothetical protein
VGIGPYRINDANVGLDVGEHITTIAVVDGDASVFVIRTGQR